MTAVGTPKIIFDLLQNELVEMLKRTCRVVSRISNVDEHTIMQELEKEFNVKLGLIPIDKEVYRIVKRKSRNPAPDDSRCQAIIKNNGNQKQCCFARCHTSEMYCKKHLKMYGEEKQPVEKNDGEWNKRRIL
jgi:hypothetical protein